MRFSYCMLPDYPLTDSIEMIKVADELGFYACYSVDETYHKDLWCLFAAAADKTSNIRFGPNVTHVFLREPTLICQQLATLDELSGGRAEAVVSIGNIAMLEQYHVAWNRRKPISRLREAIHVMRTFLDDGKIDFDGDFFKYTGLFTAARPIQERVPLKLGGMKGPRSFELAGEIADRLHHALSYSRPAYDYVIDHVKIGAAHAGRSWQQLDLGAWVVSVVSEDSAAAKRAARILVASTFRRCLTSSLPAMASTKPSCSPCSTPSMRDMSSKRSRCWSRSSPRSCPSLAHLRNAPSGSNATSRRLESTIWSWDSRTPH
jgi:5,10-methylenetetrahydromethanopterin reductase